MVPTTAPLQKHAASFGHKAIDEAQRQKRVNSVFGRVASRYDVMNDAMSLGVHRLWKAEAIKALNPQQHEQLLDIAGGTGDMTERMLKQVGQPQQPIILSDINPDMLAAGQDRFTNQPVTFLTASAESLPLPSCSVDAAIISFGLRNVTHIDNALADIHRVLKPGGRLFCLEFSHAAMPWLQKIYDAYSYKIIPWLGQIIGKDRAAYEYLVESIRMFPKQGELVAAMETAGFRQASYRNFSGGIVALHRGYRL